MYAASPANRRGTTADEKFTIRPNLRFRINFTASRLIMKVPQTLMLRARSSVAVGVNNT
jgi:hypothetical protein